MAAMVAMGMPRGIGWNVELYPDPENALLTGDYADHHVHRHPSAPPFGSGPPSFSDAGCRFRTPGPDNRIQWSQGQFRPGSQPITRQSGGGVSFSTSSATRTVVGTPRSSVAGMHVLNSLLLQKLNN
jgi:hypothetical protein